MFHARPRWSLGGLIAAALLLAGWSAVPAGDDRAPDQPLVAALGELQPRAVWQHFYELTQIPRASHNEAQVSTFIAGFGRRLGLETHIDAAGNVLIRKPATDRTGAYPAVVLQGHMDMVFQQAADAPPGAGTSPVNAYLKEGWVHADRTSLGADGGIGVALIMAVLAAKDVAHGPLEALFTVGEEDGFVGIKALKPDVLSGRLYINVDNPQEGQLVISCAGATRVQVLRKYTQTPLPAGMSALKVTIDGLVGGHSGLDIDKGRANANQLIARLIDRAPPSLAVQVASIEGGAKWNVIPQGASAVVALPEGQVAPFRAYVDAFGSDVRKAYAATDPAVVVTTTPVQLPATAMDLNDQHRVLHAAAEAPNGVQTMSAAVPGQVETSNNFGIFKMAEGDATIGVYVRSSRDATMALSAERLAAWFEGVGATVKVNKMYASWPPNPNSKLLGVMKQAYRAKFGTLPAVAAVHAGLETAEVRNLYPDMDMVAMGPTITGEHTPQERLEIASVQRAYDLLVATLMQLR